MRWFGESWGAALNLECEHTATPVGFPCDWCLEPIADEDRGVVLGGYVYHLDCHLRQAIGGVNHLRGTCICHGGTEDPDPAELTRREAASAAAELFRSMRHA